MLGGCDGGDLGLPSSQPSVTPQDNSVAQVVSSPTTDPSQPSSTVEVATPTPVDTFTPVPPEPTATDTEVAIPTSTATEVEAKPTRTRAPTQTEEPAQPQEPEASPTPAIAQEGASGHEQEYSRVVNGRFYDAYIPAATKKKQAYHYSCEFDAAWVVLKTFGYDVSVDDQIAIVGQDMSIEPYYKETEDGIFIYGGDITNFYSGDYKENFLARSSGMAMQKLFEHFDLSVTPVHDREGLETALRSGSLVWIKIPVDFKAWRPSTWVMPDGRTYKTVLGNDHAVVVMGYNEDGVVIRDVLGPTNTNWERKYEYEVPWKKFLAGWGAQSYDGLAVGRPTVP